MMWIMNMLDLTAWFTHGMTEGKGKPVIGARSILGMLFPNLVTEKK
jgi:hypothetical protein